MSDAHTGVPAYFDETEPNIADHARGAKPDDWEPANYAAIKLIRCLEAIRDIKCHCEVIADAPIAGIDKRFLKGLATPLHSLAEAIRDVYGEIQNSEFRRMSKKSRRAFLQARRKILCRGLERQEFFIESCT